MVFFKNNEWPVNISPKSSRKSSISTLSGLVDSPKDRQTSMEFQILKIKINILDFIFRSTSSPTPQLTTTQSQPTTKSSKDLTSKNPATKSRKSVPSKRVAHSPSGAPNLPTMMSCMSEAPLRLTQPVNVNNHNNSNDFSEVNDSYLLHRIIDSFLRVLKWKIKTNFVSPV